MGRPAWLDCWLDARPCHSSKAAGHAQIEKRPRVTQAADDDLALRRAILRRTRPTRGTYAAGSWAISRRQSANQKGWFGPARVQQEQSQWPEHIRPISTLEKALIPQDHPSLETVPSDPTPTEPESTTDRVIQISRKKQEPKSYRQSCQPYRQSTLERI